MSVSPRSSVRRPVPLAAAMLTTGLLTGRGAVADIVGRSVDRAGFRPRGRANRRQWRRGRHRKDELAIGDRVEDYVGTDYDSSSLEVWHYAPTSESWNYSDRDAIFMVYDMDLDDLVGSVKSSGL